ncbi:MAG TPA: hypothetical protein ENO30_00710 [Thermodesulfobium narugense]|nr:hypothetical protein [Thermodesulfobium narugense]
MNIIENSSFGSNDQYHTELFEILFKDIGFSDNEYVELVYDNGGNKNFAFAYHVRTKEELQEFLRLNNGKCNISICPNTRTPKVLNKRTGKDAVKSQKCVILDVENTLNHGFIDKEKVKKMLENTIEMMPEHIRDAIGYLGYTGGGGQIGIILDRVAKDKEIPLVYEYLKELLQNIPYIDKSSFNYGQPQRLLGTFNVKYSVESTLLETRSPDPLSVNIILKYIEAKTSNYYLANTHNERSSCKRTYTNCEDAVREIKARVKFEEFLEVKNRYKGYYKASCIFHPPDNDPSFVVYEGESELGLDTHNNQVYDIISFYEALKGISRVQAIEELAERIGYKLIKREVPVIGSISDFNPEEYLRHELKVKKIEYCTHDGEITFEFTIMQQYKDLEIREVKFTEKYKNLINYKSALKRFQSYIINIPKPLPEKREQEAWGKVIDYIIRNAEVNPDDVERSPSYLELEYLLRFLANGNSTDNVEDYLVFGSKFTLLEINNRFYVNIPALVDKLSFSPYPLTRVFNVQKVSKLLRDAGCINVGRKRIGDNIRIRLVDVTDVVLKYRGHSHEE